MEGKVYQRYANEGFGIGMDEIPEADFNTFSKIGTHSFGSYMAKDKNHVYHKLTIIKEADPGSFTYIGRYTFKDKNHVYFFGFYNPFFNNCIIKDADPKSFHTYNKHPWSFDRNNIYWGYNMVLPKPGHSFVPINYSWGKDDKSYYHEYNLVENADFITFKIINDGYAIDKDHVFYEHNIIPDCSPKNFVAITTVTGHDGKYFYFAAKREGELTAKQKAAFKVK